MSDFALPGSAAAAAGPGTEEEPIALPTLRDDLELLEGPRSFDGAPTWTIHDPVRNRYFRIGHAAFQLLSRWPLGEGRRVIAHVNANTTQRVGEAELERLLRFLEQNDLLADSSPRAARVFAERKARQRQHWAKWLLKNYLFIRIPLVRPDRLLAGLLPLVRPLFGRGFLLLSLTAAVLGLVLAVRQWDSFVHTFLHFLSWEGAAYYVVALFAAKVLHELGHAFAAKLNGCRVPTMGVAFLVLWPVLYTDVTDAWRLTSRRERLRIGAAGMGTELVLAAWATLAWSFLPDGPLRSACFLLATVTWVLTLAINLNPFLRFDGYYLLSDWLGVQNLQERGFALGRWRLRRTLFGLDLPKPEQVGPRLERRLLLYAYATWIWRFFLFLGIALLVYHLFFKLLGLFLMIVELAWFLARPMWNELKAWWSLRDRMRPNLNIAVTLLVLGGLVAVLAVPWQAHLRAPATIEARQAVAVFPPDAARLEAVLAEEGETVGKGAPLYRLANPQLDQKLRLAELRLGALQHEILRRSASRTSTAEVGVLEEQLAETLADLRGLRAQATRLKVTAPAEGVLSDVPRHLVAGRWVSGEQALGRVVDTGGLRITAYVTAEQLARLAAGPAASVYPDDPLRPAIEARVTEVEAVDVEVLQDPWLASTHGGPLAVQQDPEGRLVPVQPLYRVHLRAEEGTAAPSQKLTGVARIDARAESLLARLWRTAASVFIRESGF
jgi:putative peptide zinc metalloprotease protein